MIPNMRFPQSRFQLIFFLRRQCGIWAYQEVDVIETVGGQEAEVLRQTQQKQPIGDGVWATDDRHFDALVVTVRRRRLRAVHQIWGIESFFDFLFQINVWCLWPKRSFRKNVKEVTEMNKKVVLRPQRKVVE